MPANLELFALDHFPLIEPGDDLASTICASLRANGLDLAAGDCLVVAQKIVSKAEGRFVSLRDVRPSETALDYAAKTHKDPALVELILRESEEIVRWKPGVLVAAHKLGFVHANAGIDQSNIEHSDGNPQALLLPQYPNASAQNLRKALGKALGIQPSIVISDSAGRAWRNGITGFAIGSAGFEALVDKAEKPDLYGRKLMHTQIAIADEIASAASLLMGQADEGCPVVVVRGLDLPPSEAGAETLIRPKHEDMFR